MEIVASRRPFDVDVPNSPSGHHHREPAPPRRSSAFGSMPALRSRTSSVRPPSRARRAAMVIGAPGGEASRALSTRFVITARVACGRRRAAEGSPPPPAAAGAAWRVVSAARSRARQPFGDVERLLRHRRGLAVAEDLVGDVLAALQRVCDRADDRRVLRRLLLQHVREHGRRGERVIELVRHDASEALHTPQLRQLLGQPDRLGPVLRVQHDAADARIVEEIARVDRERPPLAVCRAPRIVARSCAPPGSVTSRCSRSSVPPRSSG